MRSGCNSFNYFLENKLTKLANLEQLKHMLMFCLKDWVGGTWAPSAPFVHTTGSTYVCCHLMWDWFNFKGRDFAGIIVLSQIHNVCTNFC